ncbi:MAG TPA: M1 family metallopeptidase [Bacteroidales bacterium]|nr:M1 family metallopeptidase [Bacteroidales bacterium]
MYSEIKPANFMVFTFLLLAAGFSSLSAQKTYFQQEVNYNITVTLDDTRGVLDAYEVLEYINNSPDTLSSLYFHLWPNAYSDNNTALAKQLFVLKGKQKLFRDNDKQGWIDSLDFKVNDSPAEWEYLQGNPDICLISLQSDILPGDTVLISTPFRVKVPTGNISRMGFNNDVYQISQWYPKPAVYDRNGWHPMPYLDQGEFFSEFGRFDVTINLPENFVVGASGNLETESEANRIENEFSQWHDPQNYPGPVKMKSVRFTRENIHDFAWVAGKKLHVDIKHINLPDSGREITIYVMYDMRSALLWVNAREYAARAIRVFSEWIGDFPYDSYTVVQTTLAAGSGMEYPGMAIIGDAEDDYTLDEVIAHEICHSWFYSALGSDERTFPFMDEGITSAYETRYMQLFYPDKKLWELYFRNPGIAKLMKIQNISADRISEIQWLVNARENLEQPANLAAPCYTDRNYADVVYYKTGQGFNYLRSYLGDTLFDSIMHAYYTEWKGRHPSPEDLKSVFESHKKIDLTWFFNDFLGTVERYDYKISRLKNDSILIMNRGEMISPFSLTAIKNNKVSFIQWQNGFKGKKWVGLNGNDFSEIRLNYDHIVPEIIQTNNNIRKTGLFRKSDPFSPQLLASVEDPGRRTMIVIPLLNWNRSDGFMAGLAANNGFMMPKPIEYFILPFYTFRDPGISGKGRVTYNIVPYNSIVRKLGLSLEGAHFGATEFNDYTLLRPGIDIWFRNNNPVSGTSAHLYAGYVHATDIRKIFDENRAGYASFGQLRYSITNSRLVNPYDFVVLCESGSSYGKISAGFKYRISYYGRNKGLDFRLFTGMMLWNNNVNNLYSFAPSGRQGRELYLYEGDFPDRFTAFPDNIWSGQMVVSEGSLVTYINDSTGFSSSLISLSLTSNLPGAAGYIPIKPFTNIVYAGDLNKGLFLEAGIRAGIPDFLEVYIPFIVSDNISSLRNSVKERIRFVLNLSPVFRFRM